MTRDCPTCHGTGTVGVGERIGPEEYRCLATCGECKGTGREAVRCDLCGDVEAQREAWVVDSDNKRKASLLRLCLDCHDDRKEVDLAIPPTRVLPSREEDADLQPQRIQAALEALRAVHNAGVGHA